ncbi:MAG: hypothetical protein R3F62_21465 [Planctomycetota bacterium]
MSARRLALAALCLSAVACYPSNVVAPESRDVVEAEQPALRWHPAQPDEVPGFYVSSEVEGASAGALLRAYYYFDSTGSYSGGALVLGEYGPRFVVITEDGRWTLTEGQLDLHDGSTGVTLDAAENHLRLQTAESTLVFRREPLD